MRGGHASWNTFATPLISYCIHSDHQVHIIFSPHKTKFMLLNSQPRINMAAEKSSWSRTLTSQSGASEKVLTRLLSIEMLSSSKNVLQPEKLVQSKTLPAATTTGLLALALLCPPPLCNRHGKSKKCSTDVCIIHF